MSHTFGFLLTAGAIRAEPRSIGNGGKDGTEAEGMEAIIASVAEEE